MRGQVVLVIAVIVDVMERCGPQHGWGSGSHVGRAFGLETTLSLILMTQPPGSTSCTHNFDDSRKYLKR